LGGLGFIVIIALLGLMWALMIRPQRRRQAQQQDMLSDLAIGDEILTAGGIYGTVDAIDADEVSVEIAPGTKIRIAKRAVAAVIPEEEEDEEEEADDEPEADKPEEAGNSVGNPTSAEENPG
jgi:preprotein translocase subunit YajC